MVKYAVIGGVSVDNVMNMDGEVRLDQFGGNAAYGCAGVRLWEKGQVGMVARCGNDFPRDWLQCASEAGIDIRGVSEIAEPHGLFGGMVYDRSGNRDNYVSKDTLAKAKGRGNEEASPWTLHQAQLKFGADASDIPPSYDGVQGVLLAPRYLNNQLSCIEHYKKQGNPCIIADPMRFYMYLERSRELSRLLEAVDAFLPSETELNHLFGEIEPVEGAKRLGEMGAKVVVVKLGHRGCIVYEREKDSVTALPICRVDAKDPTGAGDSFCGGFLVGLVETKDPVIAAMYGTVSSSFVVEGFGAEYTYGVTGKMAAERLSALKRVFTETNEGIAQRLEGWRAI